MDTLSQLLRSFRLRSSFHAAWEFTAPWGLSFAATRAAPFHYVESGSLWLVTSSGRRLEVEAGEVVVLFDGSGHRIADRPDRAATPMTVVKRRTPRANLMRYGGGGRRTLAVCGNFILDEHKSFAGSLLRLPGLVHLRRDSSRRVLAFTRALELLAQEVRSGDPGSEHAAVLLTELLFVEVLREALDSDPAIASWIEGLRDPAIGAALAAIHAAPQEPWTLQTLARKVGMSRSTLARRFHDRLGVPPMAYLARWRLQLAARWLRDGELVVSEIIERLGYGSHAAFHRAFKRQYGVAPTRYRERERASDASLPGGTRLIA